MSRPGSAHSQHADLAHEIAHGDHHAHQNEHGRHHGGFKGWLVELFVPHTHDAADSIDDAMEASIEGVRALKVSLFLLLGTTVLQFLVVLISGSVALLADTIHNFSDALTAVPLWVAFILGRRAATRRYTYGFGRGRGPGRPVHRRRRPHRLRGKRSSCHLPDQGWPPDRLRRTGGRRRARPHRRLHVPGGGARGSRGHARFPPRRSHHCAS